MIKWLEKNRVISLIIVILIAVEIFYFSSLSGDTGVGGSIWISRIYHFVVFFLFSFFLFATIKGNKKIKVSYVVITLIISIFYAISDEIHQIFVPLRDANIRDVLIDTLGICFAIIICLIINKKTNQQI